MIEKNKKYDPTSSLVIAHFPYKFILHKKLFCDDVCDDLTKMFGKMCYGWAAYVPYSIPRTTSPEYRETYYFKTEEDALAFILKFGGN